MPRGITLKWHAFGKAKFCPIGGRTELRFLSSMPVELLRLPLVECELQVHGHQCKSPLATAGAAFLRDRLSMEYIKKLNESL